MRRPPLLLVCALLGATAGASIAGAGARDRPQPTAKARQPAPRPTGTRVDPAAKVDRLPAGWPYTPPAAAAVPKVKRAGWCRNPVDHFILAALEARGLNPSPPAGKVTLLRRVYLDLVGMPPTPAEADAFLQDPAPDAYEQLVDRLLADPRYGERWARHWLDLVRYADSDGFEYDKVRPHAWRYRDYVIRSLNEDKPYDRFLKEQLAGDELYPGDPDALVATGFARLGPWDEATSENNNPVYVAQRWQDYLNDVTDTTGSVMLGLTVGCARCHDHKYDRLTQVDYYRLQAFFAATSRTEETLPNDGNDPPTLRQKAAAADRHLQTLRQQLETLRERHRAAVLAEKQKSAKPGEKLVATDEEVAASIKRTDGEVSQKLEDQIREGSSVLALYQPVADVAVDDGREAPKTHLLQRGELQTPGPEVSPGFIASLCEGSAATPPISPPPGGKSTGRRTALANWIASRANPMTARVMVNRLWQHHFGRGLLGTPSDFGRNGERPSHPELLDWLAVTFARGAGGNWAPGSLEPSAPDLPLARRPWSLKALHRLMLLSSTYRQSTRLDPVAAKADPENRLLWRMNSLRLEGEALRDSILAVSGRLARGEGGPGVYPPLSAEVVSTSVFQTWGDSPEEEARRRSIYVFQRRTLMLPLIEAFDGAAMANTCPRRAVTTIAPQALALLNDAFSRSEARGFAERVLTEAGADPARQVEHAYRLALVRQPTATETAEAREFLARQAALSLKGKTGPDDGERRSAAVAALADFCLALINCNEFLYLE
jgi:hypothetical protein